MTLKKCLLVVVLLTTTLLFAQTDKDVLMTIDGNPVYAKEFIRVYKKNLDLVKDESQKDVENYLDLFIDYKLKIAAAYEEKLNENASFLNDFKKYEAQLSRNYLFEDKVTSDMAKEAYERNLEEVEVSHILIQVDYAASPKDTLTAYNKIKDIREKALKGEDFTALAKKYSEEPGAIQRAGYLGYFSAFTMVYPFETAAYETKKGAVSGIVRTQFGYHILKVTNRRIKEPEIQVSHIMIGHKGDSSMVAAKNRIDEIYALLEQGQSFESLAKQFSEDKNSAVKGGELSPFGKGALRAPKFEEIAYSLTKEGEVSEPFKTSFGWHIIKFGSRLAIPTFEDQKAELEKKVSMGDRSKIVTSAINSKLKETYGFKVVAGYLPFFETYVSDSIQKKKWNMTPISDSENKVIFTLGDDQVTYMDFATFISEKKSRYKILKTKAATLADLYEEFEDAELKAHFMSQLEKSNEEYAVTVGEYRDGLLIFDVMNSNIWGKAKKDTLGLQKFYEVRKENYLWKERVDVALVSATSEQNAKRVQDMFKNGMTANSIKTKLMEEDVILIVTNDTLEIDSNILPEKFIVKKGISDIYRDENSYVVADVKEVLAPSSKDFESIKGLVTTDYQNKLEKDWMERLRTGHEVEVNKKVLKKIIKKLKS